MTTTPTVGSEVEFSPFLTDFAPEVAALRDGTFDIVWQREGGDLVGRHLDELGSFTGGDFLSDLSGFFTQELSGPQIFQQTDGRVVLNFNELFGPGDHDIRWHSPDEADPTHASFATEGSGLDEILEGSTARAGGGAANVFELSDGVHTNLVLRFTDAIGQQASNLIFVGPHAGQVQQNAAVAGLHTGFVAVAYENVDTTTGARDIRFHVYTPGEADATPNGEVTASASGVNAAFPDITELRDGSFVVAWQQSGGLAFQHYIGNGFPTDPSPTVISLPSQAFLPKITPLNDGGFMIAWTGINGQESDGSPNLDVFAQRFDRSGHAVGDQIHLAEPGDQGLGSMSIATLADGRVILTYGSETGDATNVTTLDYRILDPRDHEILGTNGADNFVSRDDGAHISGFDGNDRLTGRDAIDMLDGGNGDDVLLGFGGNDILDGGAGNDRLDGGTGSDTASYVDAGAGVTVSLALTAAQNTGGAGVENLIGSGFNDHLTGNSGANILDGGLGNDVLNGGAGNDTASYASAGSGVTVSLAVATAQQTFGAGTDTLAGVENLTGSGFNDNLTGNSGANVLDGGLGGDVLHGGGGNDVLVGGNDPDQLFGGAGADHFVYRVDFDSTPVATERDVIHDFSHAQHDLIDLHLLDARTSTRGNDAFSFIGTKAFSAEGQVHYSFVGGNTLIEVNDHGASGAEMQILLSGHVALTAGDFVL